MDTLVTIYKDFWSEDEDNVVYKGLYRAFEAVKACKPRDWFSMPLIQAKLDECSSNSSRYIFFGKGNGAEASFIYLVY